MPRKIPPCPSRPQAPQEADVETKTYEIEVITPMFGGGAEAGTPDENFPIRGTAIRGQLEFWWRATCGAKYPDKDALFERHVEVWGTTDRASPVIVEVHVDSPVFIMPMGGSLASLKYILFPFQASAKYLSKASFTLRVRYRKGLRSDVEMAVWAWVNFGGLGARTRRGCGSLLCKELAPENVGAIKTWFEKWTASHLPEKREWPVLPGNILVQTQTAYPPRDAWEKIISCYQSFRQGPGLARNPGSRPNRPGRSRWPEPEVIRKMTGSRAPQHSQLPYMPQDAFPRAEFGLPIVFHFKDRGDPPDTTLTPPNDERMASPLIIKPLALVNGKAVPLIVRLMTPALDKVELRGGKKAVLGSGRVRGSHLATYRNSPLGKSRSGSALEAFLDYALSKGFKVL